MFYLVSVSYLNQTYVNLCDTTGFSISDFLIMIYINRKMMDTFLFIE